MKIYEQEGWVAQVQVLQDRSNDKEQSYKLKVIRNISKSPIFGGACQGRIFQVMFSKQWMAFRNWRLRDKDDAI